MRILQRVAVIGRIAVVAAAALVVSACPAKPPAAVRTAVTTGLPGVGGIAVPYSGSVPTGGGGWTLVSLTGAPWLTLNPATGAVSGTPDGNDFGTWNVLVNYSKGTTTRGVPTTIVVPAPTLTSIDPATGFVVALYGTANVDVTIGPAPPTAYNGITYGHDVVVGPANVTLSGPATTAGGPETLTLSWQYGETFTGKGWVIVPSNAPGQPPASSDRFRPRDNEEPLT